MRLFLYVALLLFISISKSKMIEEGIDGEVMYLVFFSLVLVEAFVEFDNYINRMRKQ